MKTKKRMLSALMCLLTISGIVAPSLTNETSILNPFGMQTVMASAAESDVIDVIKDNIIYKLKTSIATAAVVGTNSTTKIEIIIPDTIEHNGKTYRVSTIGDNAFKNNKKIRRIRLSGPTGNLSIGASAFEGCTSLTEITNLENYYAISENAFKDCTGLTIVNLSSVGSSVLKNNSFDGCNNIRIIDLSLKKNYKISNKPLNSNNLLQFTGLTSIIINDNDNDYEFENNCLIAKDRASRRIERYMPNVSGTVCYIDEEITSIAKCAFSDTKLEHINVASNNPYLTSRDGVLYTKDMKTLYAYPPCRSNETFTTPSSVTELYESAFNSSKNLKNLNISNNAYCTSGTFKNSSISLFNGDSRLTDNNREFVKNNLMALEDSMFVTNIVTSEVQRAMNETGALSMTSDLQKAKVLHDWLCKRTMYVPRKDDGEYIDDLSNGCYHCSSSAFVMDYTVCDGYARAYSLLLDYAGVENQYVLGNVVTESHAWNVVKLGNTWLYVDCTSDDGVTCNYVYFMKTAMHTPKSTKSFDCSIWFPGLRSSESTSTLPDTSRPMGDVNGDNSVTEEDICLLKDYLVGRTTLDETSLYMADCDYDGMVTSNDLIKILQKKISKGDVNGDGDVTNLDIALLQKYLLGQVELGYAARYAADFNNDGQVDAIDLVWLCTTISLNL